MGRKMQGEVGKGEELGAKGKMVTSGQMPGGFE